MSAQHRKHPRSRRRKPHEPRGPRREHIEELHPTENAPSVESFEEWDLGEETQRSIFNMGITVPTPIQALSIGAVLEGRDVIAKAETGTGKTLAFGAPMLSRIDAARSTVLALVLCPTRELAQQVSDVIAALALPRGVKVALVVGGDPMHGQIAALQAGAQVVVGTPGRVLDLYQQRFLSFPWTEYVVLDEADKMFEIGFLDDIKKILSFTPEERQTLLFSATFPTEVLKLAREETREPVEVATQRGTATVDLISQRFLEIPSAQRELTLVRLLESSDQDDVFLVFCDRRTDVDYLIRRLERLPFPIKALHGGYDQASRFRVMSAFRTGEVKALIATDVASRGLDVQHVTHVVNVGVPRDVEDYTHRIGRTGRAGRTGTAITFVVPQDKGRWRSLVGRGGFTVEPLDPPRGRRPGHRGDAGQSTREGKERGRGRRDERPADRDRPDRDRRDRRPKTAPEPEPAAATGAAPFGASLKEPARASGEEPRGGEESGGRKRRRRGGRGQDREASEGRDDRGERQGVGQGGDERPEGGGDGFGAGL